jgi:N-acetylglucosaminyldiphosphoundecaprenol N-acetyl-beta-D-mannosaminyltransferase
MTQPALQSDNLQTPDAIAPQDLSWVRGDVLGVWFDLLDYSKAIWTIEQWRRCGRREMVMIHNPNAVMLCRCDPGMAQVTDESGLVVPDGVGIILASRILGYPHHGRVTGPTLLLKLCDWGRRFGYRHYFFGGKEGVADLLAARLREMYPGLIVAGTYCPPFRPMTAQEDRQVVEQINAARPDILWVGLGCPKQEKWMLAHKGRIDAAATIGVGAAFDFHSDQVKWAPFWIRRLGLEWAFRLLCDPRRLWRRNLLSFYFLLAVLGQRIMGRRRISLKPSSLKLDKLE